MILIDGREFEQKFFGDGTAKMLEMDNYFFPEEGITRIEWRFDNIGEFMILYYITCYAHDIRRCDIELTIPYMPDARMDRTKHPEREVPTLKYSTQFLNDLGYRSITVTDPHSPVTMTLLHRAKEKTVKRLIEEVLRIVNVDLFLFPDKGAKDRYTEYLNERPAEYGNKTRNWDTGRIDGFALEMDGDKPLADKDVLIIDDIVAYGGTFHHAVNAAHEAGARNIYLFVTHCENDILKGDLINNPYVTRIFTTNSIYRSEHEKIWLI